MSYKAVNKRLYQQAMFNRDTDVRILMVLENDKLNVMTLNDSNFIFRQMSFKGWNFLKPYFLFLFLFIHC